MLNPAFLLPLGAYYAEPPPEPDLPIEIRTMLEEAMASGNDNDVATTPDEQRALTPCGDRSLLWSDIGAKARAHRDGLQCPGNRAAKVQPLGRIT